MKNTNKILNPWTAIWIRPRAAIQQVIDTDPEHLVLVLAAITGCSQVLRWSVSVNLGDRLAWPTILLTAAVIGPMVGISALYLGGALFHWTGTWIGGNAAPRHIRAAVAWSNVPAVLGLGLIIAAIALAGQELFTSRAPTLITHPLLLYALVGISDAKVALEAWGVVLLINCLAQVQHFSAWKALGNVALTLLVIAIPTAALIAAMIGLGIR